MPLQSKLITLPTELLYITIRNILDEWEEIRRRGADDTSKNPLLTLALTCRRLERLASFILYRDITLMDERDILRLARSLRQSKGNRLATFTESVVIGMQGRIRGPNVLKDAEDIVTACGNLRALALSEEFVPILWSMMASSPSPQTRKHPRPFEITVLNLPAVDSASSWHAPPDIPAGFLSNLTHLTLAEPPEKWSDPLYALASLPLAPCALKHLTLSRKENSNIENDIIFLSCISTLLQMTDAFMDEDRESSVGVNRPEARFAGLERVTVRIYPSYGYAKHDEEADIWIAAREMASRDSRIAVEKGYWGSWIERWDRGRVY